MGAALQQAIELYTQALAFPDVPWDQYSAMVLAGAESRHFQGENAAADADISALAEQAADRGNSGIQSIALRELSLLLFYLGDLERALNLGKEALRAAEEAAQPDLKVGALVAIGLVQTDLGEHEAARQSLEQVQSIQGSLSILAQSRRYAWLLFLCAHWRYAAGSPIRRARRAPGTFIRQA